jgi:hypothetical protein
MPTKKPGTMIGSEFQITVCMWEDARLRSNGGRFSCGGGSAGSTILNDSEAWPRGGPLSREPGPRSRACPDPERSEGEGTAPSAG